MPWGQIISVKFVSWDQYTCTYVCRYIQIILIKNMMHDDRKRKNEDMDGYIHMELFIIPSKVVSSNIELHVT